MKNNPRFTSNFLHKAAALSQTIAQELATITIGLNIGAKEQQKWLYLHNVINNLTGDIDTWKTLKDIFKGALGQAAVMRMLQQIPDVYVFCPDPKEDQQLQWDINAGADIIVVSKKGGVCLVDAQSRQDLFVPQMMSGKKLGPIYRTTVIEMQQLLSKSKTPHAEIFHTQQNTPIPIGVQIALPAGEIAFPGVWKPLSLKDTTSLQNKFASLFV